VPPRGIHIPKEKLAEFCQRNHIRRLALFGSAIRGNLGPKSDLDVLVEFEPGHVPGLAFFGMEAELSKMFGRNVDLNTLQFLSPYFRDNVQKEAVELYSG
jgi:predicted nucleotidyltransferase